MAWKKCGFRDRAKVCTFPEDMCNEGCDFFNLPFETKPIKARCIEERENIRQLKDDTDKLAEDGLKHTDEYKQKMKVMADKVVGFAKLGKAYLLLKRCRK